MENDVLKNPEKYEAYVRGIKSIDELRDVLILQGKTFRDIDQTMADVVKERDNAKLAMEELKSMVVDVKNYTSKRGDLTIEEEKAYNFGKAIAAMIRRDPQMLKDARVFCIQKGFDTDHQWFGDTIRKADLGTPLYSDATSGSYYVEPEYQREVMRIALQASQFMPLVTSVPMSGTTRYVPLITTEPTFTWLSAQSSGNTETNPIFNQTTLTAYNVAAYIPITEELDEDSFVPLAMFFRDLFGEAWGKEFDRMVTSANSGGSDVTSGILYAATSNILTMSTGDNDFSDVSADYLLQLQQKLTTHGKRQGALYGMHQTVFDYVRNLKGADGHYIYERPAEGQPGKIWGYPYVLPDAMPDTGSNAASTKFLFFGNPKHVLHGNRVGMEFKVFDQTSYAVQYDEIFFRCRLRQGFKVALEAAFAVLKTAAS